MFKKIAVRVVAVSTTLGLFAMQAHAALPADVTTAISDAKTDGVAVAAGFVLAVIVISAMLVARRGAKG